MAGGILTPVEQSAEHAHKSAGVSETLPEHEKQSISFN
jgi:hypothetical protein